MFQFSTINRQNLFLLPILFILTIIIKMYIKILKKGEIVDYGNQLRILQQ